MTAPEALLKIIMKFEAEPPLCPMIRAPSVLNCKAAKEMSALDESAFAQYIQPLFAIDDTAAYGSLEYDPVKKESVTEPPVAK